MEDIGEQFNASKEISDAISKSFGYDIDEEELEMELEELEKDTIDKLLVTLPKIPHGKPHQSAKKTSEYKHSLF